MSITIIIMTCTLDNSYIILFSTRFPHSEPQRLQKWISALKWDRWIPKKSSQLCSSHFTEDCFDRTGQTVHLRLHAVPTLFTFPKHLQNKVCRSVLI